LSSTAHNYTNNSSFFWALILFKIEKSLISLCTMFLF
jgi:hypothetical protein